jgi:regulator of RNase E activity RraA
VGQGTVFGPALELIVKTLNAIALAILLLLPAPASWAQLGMFSREQRIGLTRAWTGERFEDGRPKVPDSILQRMKTVTAEEAWGVLRAARFLDQFEGEWRQFNPTTERLVGRVVTAVFMPYRPDINAVISERGKAEGRVGGGQNSWVIDTLQPGDVLVVDLFGRVNFIGDNLATSIFAKCRNGVVIHGGLRDLSGIQEIKGFTGYYRRATPDVIRDVMLMGINVPIRIENTTIMPGDVVLGDPEGLVFIPPQLAQQVVEASEVTRLRDEWGHMMLRQGRYTPGQIDARWTKEMEDEFRAWREQRKAGKTM